MLLGCAGLPFRDGWLVPDHWLRSDADDSAAPLATELLVATDVLEESEEMEDDEELRERVLRGANMPRTSSPFTELFPLMVPPHADRESCGKLGALATAVIWNAYLSQNRQEGALAIGDLREGSLPDSGARVLRLLAVSPPHSATCLFRSGLVSNDS